jgi:hypothetical protein
MNAVTKHTPVIHSKGERAAHNDSWHADALNVVVSFALTLVLAETVLCWALGLDNPLRVFASVFQ